MTTATTTPPAAACPAPVPVSDPKPLLWTAAEFHLMGEHGLLEGRGAKLMNGVVVEEGPMNPPHAVAGEKTEDAIRAAFGTGWRVRVQKPLVLGQTTDPEPDIAVVRGTPALGPHPTTADLVVEVSDTSPWYDLTEKMTAYARAGIADYWVLDVNGRQLHVFRGPAGDAYASHLTLAETDAVSPLAAPGAAVRVADLLP